MLTAGDSRDLPLPLPLDCAHESMLSRLFILRSVATFQRNEQLSS